MMGRPLVADCGRLWPTRGNVMDNSMGNSLRFARNVEVWIFGAFGGLVLAACLSGPSERATPPAAAQDYAAAAAVGPAAETGLPQPTYVVYVTAKRLSPAEKRMARDQAG